jgi:5-methyltetrahydrofolate--homocysteine methyltransferase
MAVKEIYEAILALKHKDVAALVQREVDSGTDISEILDDGLIAAMDELGRQYSEGSLFVPEMLIGAMAMKNGLNILKPILVKENTQPKGTIIIGTVKGDQHDVGKNLVGMMLEGGGFKVVDIGVNKDTPSFLKAIRDNGADIVALSCLLTTCMPAMKKIVGELKAQIPGINVMVGGAPISREFADGIGADGYGDNGPHSVDMARYLMSNNALNGH